MDVQDGHDDDGGMFNPPHLPRMTERTAANSARTIKTITLHAVLCTSVKVEGTCQDTNVDHQTSLVW